MKTSLTRKDYYKITNCTGDFGIPRFEFEEVCEFLEGLGYEIIVHKAKAIIKEVEYDCGGSIEFTGRTKDDLIEGILAVKTGEQLPDRLDSDEGRAMGFNTVFNKEIKKKLLK